MASAEAAADLIRKGKAAVDATRSPDEIGDERVISACGDACEQGHDGAACRTYGDVNFKLGSGQDRAPYYIRACEYGDAEACAYIAAFTPKEDESSAPSANAAPEGDQGAPTPPATPSASTFGLLVAIGSSKGSLLACGKGESRVTWTASGARVSSASATGASKTHANCVAKAIRTMKAAPDGACSATIARRD